MSLQPSSDLQVLVEEPRVAAEEEAAADIRGRSLGQIAWRRLRRDKLAMAGLAFILLLTLVAIFAGQLTQWYGQLPNTVNNFPPHSLLDPATQMPIGSFGGASGTHWLGVTPELGNDVLANLIYGVRTSLIIGVLATALATVLGTATGLISGYFGGFTDTAMSRVMDLLLSFPVLLFSIALLAIFDDVAVVPRALRRAAAVRSDHLRAGLLQLPVHRAASSAARCSRCARRSSWTRRAASAPPTSASCRARSCRTWSGRSSCTPRWPSRSTSSARPACPTSVSASLRARPPGERCSATPGPTSTIDPMYLFVPGIALFLTVLAFNLFGDGLRDALDPKSRR